MKRYLNKALMYQWFNTAKVPILIGIMIWGFIANEILNDQYYQTMGDISLLDGDGFRGAYLPSYVILGVIFLSIYFIVLGVNKRNMNMFLLSGPYTKKQIRSNELICFLITLVLFIITYIYIAITFYIRHSESFTIINGYSTIILIESIKIFLLGIIGILFILIVDSLFSNASVIALSMGFMFFSFLLILHKIDWIFRVFRNVLDVDKYINNINYIKNKFLIFNEDYSRINVRLKNFFIYCIILLVIIAIMLIVLRILQRKCGFETNNRLFSSKWSQNVISIYSAIIISMFADLIVLSDFQNHILYNSNRFNASLPLKDISILLLSDISFITIASIISYKIIKRIIKKIT
ncbi:hypothetical protein [Clostridium uliginosum]|uniref:ABC-2 family transporter protein n=1 Tax=Clostridium uliginosum TaxID=119641 RepID=A0A1I1HK49_9CLOT|nr:hypothetical protein [Clostridium uliginosum]SFC22328.1 hypothetical protein SAMN05421842_101281 [Clostridium uliginosum]